MHTYSAESTIMCINKKPTTTKIESKQGSEFKRACAFIFYFFSVLMSTHFRVVSNRQNKEPKLFFCTIQMVLCACAHFSLFIAANNARCRFHWTRYVGSKNILWWQFCGAAAIFQIVWSMHQFMRIRLYVCRYILLSINLNKQTKQLRLC